MDRTGDRLQLQNFEWNSKLVYSFQFSLSPVLIPCYTRDIPVLCVCTCVCIKLKLNSFLSQSVQSLSSVRLFETPRTAALEASQSITNSQSLPKLMSIESVMLFNHLILCRLLLLLPSILPSIRVLSNESALRIRWPKDWSFSFNISPSYEHSGLISFRMEINPFSTPSFFPIADALSFLVPQ